MRRDGRPGWLLHELSSAGRENLDADHVARYDDKEDAQADAEVEILTSLGLNEGSTLVDLGAGRVNSLSQPSLRSTYHR